ncbi:hypothetical protein LUZ60_008457 [Juncus effusus]|nr:hypothetical protein LUZ60_008457 [Juncus effusus]
MLNQIKKPKLRSDRGQIRHSQTKRGRAGQSVKQTKRNNSKRNDGSALRYSPPDRRRSAQDRSARVSCGSKRSINSNQRRRLLRDFVKAAEMSAGKQTLRDLAEEAKKRAVLILICVFGMSYLMSLTSSSVWINIPFAAALLLLFRYISLDFDIKRKANQQSTESQTHQAQIQRRSSLELHSFPLKKNEKKSDWRKKVNSPPVEAALERFSRHLVNEWVTDLWYSKITPDRDGPEELVGLINGVLSEIADRARDVNLINLLTRDITNLICDHLELYRVCQAKIGKEKLLNLNFDRAELELKSALESEKKLHPALHSPASEHKVLQHLTNALVSTTLSPDDLNCNFFKYAARELLACVVLRPVINLLNPRFINERIEGLAIMLANRALERRKAEQETLIGPPPMPSSDELYQLMDKSSPGLELVQFRSDQSNNNINKNINKINDKSSNSGDLKGGLLSLDKQKRSSNSNKNVLDKISKNKREVLAPEHFENLWTKGRDYKKIEHDAENNHNHNYNNINRPIQIKPPPANKSYTNRAIIPYQERKIPAIYEESESSDSSEEESLTYQNNQTYENNDNENNIMGLDSPGTRVWESKGRINTNHIHHPLESHKKTRNRNPGKKRETNSRFPNRGEGQGVYYGEVSDEVADRVHSGIGASSSSVSSFSSHSSGYSGNDVLADSFIKLRCEVIGANIVKSGSGMFAVYSVAVTDANGNSWSIKRRFRHFEELHKRLKEFPEYNLHLPPKHFLSSGLEGPVVRERSNLLDAYLKKLLQIPTISGSIEVWDFLSVDSQTYIFTDSLSIVQALSVNLDDKTKEKHSSTSNSHETSNVSTIQNQNIVKEEISQANNDGLRLRKGNSEQKKEPTFITKKETSNNNIIKDNNNNNDSDRIIQTDFSLSIKSEKNKKIISTQIDEDDEDTINPNDWTPPNLSVPVLHLVDVVFQLQDGGWIRRQAFWVAKQLLQLGMGDAFDDWLIDKIQSLRKGQNIASAINRIEQILWPDGIFLTKHPKRRPPVQASSPNSQSQSNVLTHEQEIEAARRAKFVRELIIEKAPAALVSLVGKKEYERCAEDIYSFIQSPVCLKQLAYELLELLILALFPEMDGVVKQIHEEREKFIV